MDFWGPPQNLEKNMQKSKIPKSWVKIPKGLSKSFRSPFELQVRPSVRPTGVAVRRPTGAERPAKRATSEAKEMLLKKSL